MIGIHVVHRRLAELHTKAEQLGGYHKLTVREQMDFRHCIQANANLVRKLDELKNLAFMAHSVGDMEWEQEICAQIDQMEAKLV